MDEIDCWMNKELRDKHAFNISKLRVRIAWEREKEKLRIDLERKAYLRARAKATRDELKREDEVWRNQNQRTLDSYFTIMESE